MADNQIDNFIESFGNKDFELAYIFARMSSELNNRINNTDEKLLAIEKSLKEHNDETNAKVSKNTEAIEEIEKKIEANHTVYNTLKIVAIVVAGLLSAAWTIVEIKKYYNEKNQRNNNSTKMVDPSNNRVNTMAD